MFASGVPVYSPAKDGANGCFCIFRIQTKAVIYYYVGRDGSSMRCATFSVQFKLFASLYFSVLPLRCVPSLALVSSGHIHTATVGKTER